MKQLDLVISGGLYVVSLQNKGDDLQGNCLAIDKLPPHRGKRNWVDIGSADRTLAGPLLSGVLIALVDERNLLIGDVTHSCT